MIIELKKAIFNYMVENHNEYQLINNTHEVFRQYIYSPDGNYCIGGKIVSDFISEVYKILFK